MIQVYVACDGDWSEPEVQVSGSAQGLAKFGEYLNSAKRHVKFDLPTQSNKFYPINISVLVIEPTSSGGDRLTVTIDANIFSLVGTNSALNKLGDSLVNFFDSDSSVGEHFHLDYYEGNEVLNDTSCHLIFICDQ